MSFGNASDFPLSKNKLTSDFPLSKNTTNSDIKIEHQNNPQNNRGNYYS